MMPGPSLVIECPKCQQTVIQETLTSGNTFGARIWSDRYKEAPMLPDYPEVTKCRNCKTIFWLSKGKVVKELYFIDPEIEQQLKDRTLVYAKHLNVKDLSSSLTEIIHEYDDELYLRYHLWWQLNKRIRKIPAVIRTKSHEQLFLSNLIHILNLVEPLTDLDSIIFRCEVLREIGLFKEAEDLAKRGFSGYDYLLRQILLRCRLNDAKVFELDYNRPDVILETNVTGLQYHDYSSDDKQCELSWDTKLTLKREPDNNHDTNAIAVYTERGKIGYIPRERNQVPAFLMDKGENIEAEVITIDPKENEWDRLKIVLLTRLKPEDTFDIRAHKNMMNGNAEELPYGEVD